MLRVGLPALNAIDLGSKPVLSVKIHFQRPEVYTTSDLLKSVEDISQSLSTQGRYEIGNSRVQLLNRGYYFSKLFARELPNNKLCEIFMTIAGEQLTVFRGVVGSGWTLTPTLLTVNVNA